MVRVTLNGKAYWFGLTASEIRTMNAGGYWDHLGKIIEKKDLLRAGAAMAEMLGMSFIRCCDLEEGVGRVSHSHSRILQFTASEEFRIIFNEVVVSGQNNGRIAQFAAGVLPGGSAIIELGGDERDTLWKED